MLTLLVTVLATAYFVVPELLSRYILSFFLVRKVMNSPRGEELVRGAFWAVGPLAIAWLTRNSLLLRVPATAGASVQTVFTSLYSDTLFAQNPAAFFGAFATFARMNFDLLARAYFIVAIGSAAIGVTARKFGWVREHTKRHLLLSKLIHWLVLPRISEWHLALSPMLLNDQKQYSIEVDVMTKSGTLYRGAVSEKNIASDGRLQTLILAGAERFLYADYLRARTKYEELPTKNPDAKPNREKYWRKIPGVAFFLVGDDIASINVRHVSAVADVEPKEDPKLKDILEQLSKLVNVDLARLSSPMFPK
jgi:hypothetical protein